MPVSLADALFTKTQQRLLVLPFGQPSRSFFTTELIELTGSGAVQRELKRLTSSGLVNVTLIGKRKHYQADRVPTIHSRILLSRESIVFNRPRMGVAPKLIIINELWDDAWARHLWDRTPVFDMIARAETTRDRIGGFGRASAASEWLVRHAAPIACRSV